MKLESPMRAEQKPKSRLCPEQTGDQSVGKKKILTIQLPGAAIWEKDFVGLTQIGEERH